MHKCRLKAKNGFDRTTSAAKVIQVVEKNELNFGKVVSRFPSPSKTIIRSRVC